MTLVPFPIQAASECPPLDTLLLAAAAEFRPVEVRRTRAALDRLAARLHARANPEADPIAHANAVVDLLVSERLRTARRASPENAMLDRVAVRGEGHPALLSVLCVEAGRRAGLPLAPIGTPDRVLVGVNRGDRPLIVDPGEGRGCPPPGIAWQCAHEVAFVVLSELARLSAMCGRLGDAIRGAELRGRLPVADALRRRIEFEAGALRAQLN